MKKLSHLPLQNQLNSKALIHCVKSLTISLVISIHWDYGRSIVLLYYSIYLASCFNTADYGRSIVQYHPVTNALRENLEE